MSALTEFLLARISEDEARVTEAADDSPVPADCWPPDRVLAECTRSGYRSRRSSR